jgi:hypothetical protein
MKAIIVGVGILIQLAVILSAGETERFVQKVKLPSGQTVVVAEGDFEPRSIGSYSVRLYSTENPPFPTDNFLAGVVHKRDGAIEKILRADIDGDSSQEVVVVVRCVGSGSYLSAQAFSIGETSVALCAAVAGLKPDVNPISALKQRASKKQ